jgi:hypothetical protein
MAYACSAINHAALMFTVEVRIQGGCHERKNHAFGNNGAESAQSARRRP